MNLEYFARNLTRLHATSIVLVSGNPVMLRFPSGDKFAQQSLGHGDLTNVLLESAPATAHAAIRAGKAPPAFPYESNGVRYRIAVEAAKETWKITISLLASEDDGPPPVTGTGIAFSLADATPGAAAQVALARGRGGPPPDATSRRRSLEAPRRWRPAEAVRAPSSIASCTCS
jgi:hypothetical protein